MLIRSRAPRAPRDDAASAGAAISPARAALRRRPLAPPLALGSKRAVALPPLRLVRSAIVASANAVIVTGDLASGCLIEYVNPAFERITGYRADEVLGRNCKFLQGGDDAQSGLDEIRAALIEEREGNAVLRNYRKDGSLFWNHLYVAPVRDERGRVRHFVASQYDVTDIKTLESKLRHQANHDELSGLANRSHMQAQLSSSIANARRGGHGIWVAFVNVDRFKVINDSLGHSAGDSVLRIIGERLRAAVREVDAVGRWGGDQFVILMSQLPKREVATALLQRIKEAVARPIRYQEQQLFLTCSIGVSVYPQDGEAPDALLNSADLAARHAKLDGANTFRFNTAAMNEIAARRLQTEADLRRAIERDEFVLHYQPQVDLATGRIVGVESLIRWQHPQRGLIYPDAFIAIAEQSGLILPIGAWVLRTACAQNRAWQDAGLAPVRVAVNLSSRQFCEPGLADAVAAVLAETGLRPEHLEVEMTESIIMGDVDDAIGVLHAIKALGVRLSVDDFGTGYSSLSYLTRFPIDVIKIDRSFVSAIGEAGGDGAVIATSIVSLAHALKLCVIAEGVETAEQLQYLRERGCDEMQGYYFSRPVAAATVEQLLRADTRLVHENFLAPTA
jgi:diguanylate cyclase (GGDEF)-like protein/PAS domain S-box-containing protein